MNDGPYHATFERVAITGMAIKSTKGGRVIRMVVEIPLDESVDVSGMAHELFESPLTMKVEKIQTVALESPAAAG